MRVMFVLVILFGLVGVSLFGAFAMQHGDGHWHEGCIAAAASGRPCPQNESPLVLAVFHIAAFKEFSTAIFTESFSASLAALVLLTAGVCFSILASAQLFSQLSFAYFQHRSERVRASLHDTLTHWLALHENSPSAFYRMPV